ncbi:MAG: hypothetical protein K0Q57_531 [Gammaproteobacteria bacterium]|nr:hypothetical protein [Gammaproteobacteria bacterium]
MNNVEQRTAADLKTFIASLKQEEDELQLDSLMPVIDFFEKAISQNLSPREIADKLQSQLNQLKFAKEAIRPALRAISNLSAESNNRFELERQIKKYFKAQIKAIEEQAEFQPELAQYLNEYCRKQAAAEVGFVNYQALAIADSLKPKPASEVQVIQKVPDSSEVMELLDKQTADIKSAIMALARKANALEFCGFEEKAEGLRRIEDILIAKTDAYQDDQQQAIEKTGLMSTQTALKFKKDCHAIINNSKGSFNHHADVLPILANILLVVASAVCAFIPLVVNKVRTNSFLFFNTATFNTLAKVDKDISKAISPSIV